MRAFDITEKEIDIIVLESKAIMSQLPLITYGLMMEKEGKSLFERIIDKMKEIVEKVKEKIQSFITSKKVKDEVEKMENVVKNNPELGKEKVQIPDYSKLDKLNKEYTLKIIKGNEEQLMIKYKKQRNFLVKNLGFTIVTFAVALGMLTKYSKDKIQSLQNSLSKATDNVRKLERQNHNLSAENNELKTSNSKLSALTKDLRQTIQANNEKNVIRRAKIRSAQLQGRAQYKKEQIEKNVEKQRVAAQNQVEILSCQAKDSLDAVQNLVHAVIGPGNPIKKIMNISTAGNDVKDNIRDTVSGKGRENAKINVNNKKLDEIERIQKNIDKANKVLNDPNSTDQQKSKAQDYIDRGNKQLNRLRY